MSLLAMPSEVLSGIVALALDVHKRPVDVLCVHSRIHALGEHTFYQFLRFRSVNQLELFARGRTPLPYAPRELSVLFNGLNEHRGVFEKLKGAIRRCMRMMPGGGSTVKRLPLKKLLLKLDTSEIFPFQDYLPVFDTLNLVSPKTFVWCSASHPDISPSRDNSAITEQAASHLFRALTTWTDVEHISLSKIEFPESLWHMGVLQNPEKTPLLPSMPSLRTLYVRNTANLRATFVAAMVCMVPMPRLEQVRLVAAREYAVEHFIYLEDVERAAMSFPSLEDKEAKASALARIRQLVQCEARRRPEKLKRQT